MAVGLAVIFLAALFGQLSCNMLVDDTAGVTKRFIGSLARNNDIPFIHYQQHRGLSTSSYPSRRLYHFPNYVFRNQDSFISSPVSNLDSEADIASFYEANNERSTMNLKRHIGSAFRQGYVTHNRQTRSVVPTYVGPALQHRYVPKRQPRQRAKKASSTNNVPTRKRKHFKLNRAPPLFKDYSVTKYARKNENETKNKKQLKVAKEKENLKRTKRQISSLARNGIFKSAYLDELENGNFSIVPLSEIDETPTDLQTANENSFLEYVINSPQGNVYWLPNQTELKDDLIMTMNHLQHNTVSPDFQFENNELNPSLENTKVNTTRTSDHHSEHHNTITKKHLGSLIGKRQPENVQKKHIGSLFRSSWPRRGESYKHHAKKATENTYNTKPLHETQDLTYSRFESPLDENWLLDSFEWLTDDMNHDGETSKRKDKKHIGSLHSNPWLRKKKHIGSFFKSNGYPSMLMTKKRPRTKRHISSIFPRSYSIDVNNIENDRNRDKKHIGSSFNHNFDRYKKYLGSLVDSDWYRNKKNIGSLVDHDWDRYKKHIGSLVDSDWGRSKKHIGSLVDHDVDRYKKHIGSLVDRDRNKKHIGSLIDQDWDRYKKHLGSLIESDWSKDKKHIGSLVNDDFHRYKKQTGSLVDNSWRRDKKHIGSLVGHNWSRYKKHLDLLIPSDWHRTKKTAYIHCNNRLYAYNLLLLKQMLQNNGFYELIDRKNSSQDRKDAIEEHMCSFLENYWNRKKKYIGSLVGNNWFRDKKHIGSLVSNDWYRDKKHIGSLVGNDRYRNKKHIGSLVGYGIDKKYIDPLVYDDWFRDKKHIGSLVGINGLRGKKYSESLVNRDWGKENSLFNAGNQDLQSSVDDEWLRNKKNVDSLETSNLVIDKKHIGSLVGSGWLRDKKHIGSLVSSLRNKKHLSSLFDTEWQSINSLVDSKMKKNTETIASHHLTINKNNSENKDFPANQKDVQEVPPTIENSSGADSDFSANSFSSDKNQQLCCDNDTLTVEKPSKLDIWLRVHKNFISKRPFISHGIRKRDIHDFLNMGEKSEEETANNMWQDTDWMPQDSSSTEEDESIQKLPINKRFLGYMARAGWFPRRYREDKQFQQEIEDEDRLIMGKRHIGAVARLGWLPVRSIMRRNRKQKKRPTEIPNVRTQLPRKRDSNYDYDSIPFYDIDGIGLDSPVKRPLLLPAMGDPEIYKQLYGKSLQRPIDERKRLLLLPAMGDAEIYKQLYKDRLQKFANKQKRVLLLPAMGDPEIYKQLYKDTLQKPMDERKRLLLLPAMGDPEIYKQLYRDNLEKPMNEQKRFLLLPAMGDPDIYKQLYRHNLMKPINDQKRLLLLPAMGDPDIYKQLYKDNLQKEINEHKRVLLLPAMGDPDIYNLLYKESLQYPTDERKVL